MADELAYGVMRACDIIHATMGVFGSAQQSLAAFEFWPAFVQTGKGRIVFRAIDESFKPAHAQLERLRWCQVVFLGGYRLFGWQGGCKAGLC